MKRSNRVQPLQVTMEVLANPSTCLFDEAFSISARGLIPGHVYSVAALGKLSPQVTEVGVGYFKADQHGVVDLTTMPSLGGSYTGLQPMGVFTHAVKRRSKSEEGDTGEDVRRQMDVTKPLVVQLRLLQGHHDADAALACDTLAETEVRRRFMAPGVTRLPVREGRLRATLFIPAGSGPFPAVVDMWGTLGGLIETRSALLASRGVVSLALAYFSFEDLPKTFADLDIQYFQEAVEYLYALPSVDRTRLGVIGASKGAEIALALASECLKVKTVVAIGGVHFLMSRTQLRLSSRAVIGEESRTDQPVFDDDGLHYRSMIPSFTDVSSQAFFEVEKNPECQILVIGGAEDVNYPTVESGYALQERLAALGQGHRVHVLSLPGTGHIVNPPYSALIYSYYHKPMGLHIVNGGKPDEHAAGQLRAWRELINFVSSCAPQAVLRCNL